VNFSECLDFVLAREGGYVDDPSQAKFKNGWRNRMDALRKAAV
jgi:hypothetical protein